MVVTAMNVDKQLNKFFLGKVKIFFSNFITIPDSEEFDSKVWDIVKRTEKLTITYQVVRNGLNQTNFLSVNTFGCRRLKLMDWVVVITSSINVLRCIVLICSESDTIAVYLGDPLYRSKNRIILLLLTIFALGAMIFFRELPLHLEAKGKFVALSVWKVYRDDFNLVDLRENNLNFKRFRFTIYLASLVFYSIMLVVPIFLSFLFFTLLLTNPWIYKIPGLAFYGILWSISLVFSVTFILNSTVGFGWYILCTLIFHLFRLLDLINIADFLLNKTNELSFTQKDIQSYCSVIIRRLNSFEHAAHKLRYPLFCYFFVFGFTCDLYLWLGVIVRVHSDFVADLISLIGICIFPIIGGLGFFCGNAVTELDELVIKLHQLTLKSKLSVNTMSKVLEIMDRVAGPYNGVKVGDFLTLEKTFFILFILENISILMLITINIGPLI